MLQVRDEILVQHVIAQRAERDAHVRVGLRAELREVLRQMRQHAARQARREAGGLRDAQELGGRISPRNG